MKKSNDIDSWFFRNVVKGIIDTLILLLNLLRPRDDRPKPNNPNPYFPLPEKPLFPWLRKKMDNIIKKDQNK